MPIPAALAVGGALTAAKVAARALLKKRAATKATGGSKKSPSLKENVVQGVKEDVGRIRKARTSTTKGAAREAVQGGASRAKERLVKRGAAVGAAAGAGFAAGKSISSSRSSSSRTPNVDSTGRSTVIKMSPTKTSSTPTPKSRGSKKPPTPAETPTRKKFSNAFGAARKAGKKEFTFQGKRFNTKLRGE